MLPALTIFSALLGVALVASRLRLRGAVARAETAEEALATRVAEIAALQSLAREVLGTVDPDRIYRLVERECRKLFRSEFFFLATVDPDCGDLDVLYSTGGPGPARRVTLGAGEGLAAWVAREGRAIRIDDFREPNPPLPFRPRVADPEIRSAIAAPLRFRDATVGVLSVQSRTPAAFTDVELEILTTIGHQTAVAIENARHYALATTDTLTGLRVRDYFLSRLEEEHERAERYRTRFCVLMLDLDRFKTINDRLGHAAGDRYLRGFGRALRERLRAPDLACRYGGDEFCILLPETDLESAYAIAERLRADLAALSVEDETGALRSTVSIGIAAHPDHGEGDPRTLLLRADQALYRAKREGRDRVTRFAA